MTLRVLGATRGHRLVAHARTTVPGLRQVFVVHGEEDASMTLAAHLIRSKLRAHVPHSGAVVTL